MQRAQALTAQHAINGLPGRTRGKIIERMRKGLPLWTVKRAYDPDVAGVDFGVLGQSWLDLHVAHRLIFDIADVTFRWHADDAVRSALSDAWRAAGSFRGMRPHPGNDVADHVFQGGVRGEGDDCQITTRSLWESASTLDECRTTWEIAPESANQLLRMATYKMDEPEYGGPWNLANKMCPGGTTPRMFLVAVHIATNPPLPFLDEQATEIHWDDLYPPIRFVKIYQTIRKHMYLHDVLEMDGVDGIESVMEDISAKSKIRFASLSGRRDLDFFISPGVAQPLVGDLNLVIKSGSYLRYHWKRSPGRFINPSIASLYALPKGFLSKEKIEEISLVQSAANPPMVCWGGEVRETGGVYSETGEHYLHGVWAHNTLDNLILGRDPMGQDFLPKGFEQDDPFTRFCDMYFGDYVVPW
ncbi:hypothetical protein [Streptomyces ardesiacus]|uniref:hypothetical protein n=1 Tax=Streptomyces ardesiacus TaxID=285564 RepID=UPI00201ECD6E|nr:hypothetical protein [Streptomyces ardesiacus]MCL7369587.1 hypothetical protein [Streptomyces ardesiacus]